MAGIRAARANFVPALIVQGIMLALVLGYYYYPPTTRWLNQLADLKEQWGYAYSLVVSIIAGALIPEIVLIIFLQKGKLLRVNLSNLIFTIPFWGYSGMAIDFFYRCQAHWFGTEVTFSIVLTKVLIDQFLLNPIYVGPFGAWCYDWKNSGYSFKNIGRFFTWKYYRDVVVPILFATWGVWIPIVAILYSLPPSLQIPLFALALAMWVILYTWIAEQRAGG